MVGSNDVRVAIVSDIHGILTAFEAVLADIRRCSPDLVLHGGDLADAGSSPLEIVDHIRSLGWPGVLGNTDEMLVQPDSLELFAAQSSAPPALWDAIRQIASATRSILGEERLAWLSELPLAKTQENFALVHATPESCWRTPSAGVPSIRRVEYNVEKELKALVLCGLPGAEWTAKMLRKSSPQMP